GLRRVRWYGFPRDTNGDGIILGSPSVGSNANLLVDVVPVRDVARTFDSAFAGFSWEKDLGPPTSTLTPKSDYASRSNGVALADSYICAWLPTDTHPRMIRITFTLDDASGRLAEGQTYEYVFELP
ncbi:MAG: hypothetical protein ACREJC_06070, partial [Tepidisphaeraceae bacterium]